MIGITFALRSESSDFLRRVRDQKRSNRLITGKIDNHDVAVVHTGVGAKNCNERLEMLLHQTKPRLVISSGFAGAVTNELHSANLILAENFSDPQLLARAVEILREPRVVKLFTASAIVDSIAERNKVARESGAAAVDMETGAIVNVCNAHRLPLLSLRAISDSPSEPFPAPMSVLFDIERQRTSYLHLLGYLLRQPAAFSRLLKFSKKIAASREPLANAIVSLIREI